MMIIKCGKCMWCNKDSVLEVSPEMGAKILAWNRDRSVGFVQDALSDLPADQREQLITGTHSKCWDEMMPEDEEL